MIPLTFTIYGFTQRHGSNLPRDIPKTLGKIIEPVMTWLMSWGYNPWHKTSQRLVGTMQAERNVGVFHHVAAPQGWQAGNII